MPNRFDKFVRDENIKHLARQIEIETDPARLAMLQALLKEELARAALPADKKA